MASKYKPYPKYKDSGIQWIGEIPEGWEVRKSSSFGFFSSSGINKKTEADEALVKMVNYTDIYGNNSLAIDSKRELMTVSCPKGKVIYCNLKKGDFVFTPSSETEEDIGLSAVILEDIQNTVFSYHVIRFRPIINIKLHYKKYIGNNHFVLSQFSRTCKGTTRQILTHNDFKNILMILPPLTEQTAIANFLDKKTAKIDALIEKDKQLIELLKEKRAALINHAVTKGLPVRDQNIKMKDSGVEWIGEIPEGWEVRKIKHLAGNCSIPVQTGPFGAQLHAEDYVNEGIPFILIRNIYDGKINLKDIPFITEKDAERLSMYKLKEGDYVFSRVGTLGRCAIVTKSEEGWLISGQMLRLRLKDIRLNLSFIGYVFQSKISEDYLSLQSIGSTRESLNTEIVMNMPVSFPPLPEQTTIANFLDKATAKIDKTIQKIKEKINLLEEYKKSLIHYVVTGKVDVRGPPVWASRTQTGVVI